MNTEVQRRRYTQAHYQSLANKANRREMSEVPLLVHAGLVEQHTPEEMQAKQQHHDKVNAWHFEAMQRFKDGLRLQTLIIKEVIRERTSEDDFALLEWFVFRLGMKDQSSFWWSVINDVSAGVEKARELYTYVLLHKFLDTMLFVQDRYTP